MKLVQGFWSSYMVHALETGTFKELWLSDRIKQKIVEQDIYVKHEDKVEKYMGSNHTLGRMILHFDNTAKILGILDNIENGIRVTTNENT